MNPEDRGSQKRRGGIYDWRQFDGPTRAIVEAVADMTERNPMEMPPLQQYADTDALETLLTRAEGIEINFMYDDVIVNVGADGKLAVTIENESV